MILADWDVMLGTATHRFTVEDYDRMAETGILQPDERVELLEGQIVDMTPASPFHAGSGSQLNAVFAGLSRGRWIIWSRYPSY